MTGRARDVISLVEAAAIYRRLTGRAKGLESLAEEVRRRRHLGVWAFSTDGGRLILRGVNRARWEYFLMTRAALHGVRNVFADVDAEDELTRAATGGESS